MDAEATIIAWLRLAVCAVASVLLYKSLLSAWNEPRNEELSGSCQKLARSSRRAAAGVAINTVRISSTETWHRSRQAGCS